jgi:hypothetical protein
MVNVEGGPSIFRVKGGTLRFLLFPLFTYKNALAAAGYLTIVSASIVNQVLSKFLARLPRSEKPSQLLPMKERLSNFMSHGLARLAEFRDDSSMLMRDPTSPLSFSCVSPEDEKRQADAITEVAKDARKAFSPLGPNGRPIRKYVDKLNRVHAQLLHLKTDHEPFFFFFFNCP